MNSSPPLSTPPSDAVSAHTVRNLLQLVTDFVGRPVWQNELAPERACAHAIAAARRVGAVAAAWAPTCSGPGGAVSLDPYVTRVAIEALGAGRTQADTVIVDGTLVAAMTPAIRLGVLVSELAANAGAFRAPSSAGAVVVRIERLNGGGIVARVSNPASAPARLGPVSPFDDGGLGLAAMIADSWRGSLAFDTGDVTTVTARLPDFPISAPAHGPAA